MPEAVIVDTVRTPIGRAFKGSLAQLRPDEMGAYVVDQLLERNPEVDPATIEDVFCGCGMPQGLQAFNIGRIISLLSEKLPQTVNGVTVSRYCSSSLDAIRHAGNAIKAGEGDVYIAAGVEWVSRYNERTEPAGAADQNENLQGNERPAQRLHRDGPDRRQRRRTSTRSAAPTWTSSRSARRNWRSKSQEDGFFDREIVPVTLARRHRGRQGRRPARLLDPGEALRAARGLRRRRRHRRQLLPAQRRRRRGAADERHQGQGAGPDAARPDRHRRHLRATSPSTWASPRSARSRRCSTGPG